MKLKDLLSEMKEVQQKIGASEPYICGGVPRDKYMNNLSNVSDIDITTGDKTVDYLSLELYNKLSAKYNIFRKIMDDGHSSIYIGKFKIDFSSNFNAPNIDALLKDRGVDKPTNMQKEIFSRDFTCNALLMPIDLNKILDLTQNGFNDIQNKKIKTCLLPSETFMSNPDRALIRIIRSVYLSCKLDFEIDDAIIEFVINNISKINTSNNKGVSKKINDAFAKNPNKASFYLTKMNLWNYIPITEVVYPHYIAYIRGASQ
jgi:tRNA nucleotidyltransferase/poly(A) polymerase